MADTFKSLSDTVSSPARSLFAITPSDSADFLTGEGLVVPKALWVGTGGNIAIQGVDDATPVTLLNVPSGTLLPIRARKVMLAGTTASAIVGLD